MKILFDWLYRMIDINYCYEYHIFVITINDYYSYDYDFDLHRRGFL